MDSARVPFIIKQDEEMEFKEEVVVVKEEAVVKEEGVTMAALVEELLVENGVLARANEVIVEENRLLKLMIWQLKKKRSVKRPKCRFC